MSSLGEKFGQDFLQLLLALSISCTPESSSRTNALCAKDLQVHICTSSMELNGRLTVTLHSQMHELSRHIQV